MYLKHLEIQGYKNFRDKFSITFSKGLNVLVGENGSGKSAIIDAIRLLFLEDEFVRNPISDTDFNRPFDKPTEQAKAFQLCGNFDDLNDAEKVAFLPWTDGGQARLTLLVDNKANRYGSYKRALWGGASRASIFESELFEIINCIYLPPLRDAEARLQGGKSSRIARLLRNLNRKELKTDRRGENHPLVKIFKDFNDEMAADNNGSIVKANELIKQRLIEVLGTVFGQDTHIQFSETNFNRIVESLRLLFLPKVNTKALKEDFRSLEENSLGYNNLLYLATVLAELTEAPEEREYLRILLIEEPEAHLHPQLQVRLLKYLEETAEKKGVQIIVTTHSPVLAASVSLTSIIHLSPVNEGPTATPLSSCGLNDNSTDFLNRWLDVTKSTLLFAKGVILVEGIAEAMLLPELAKLVLRKFNNKLKTDKHPLPESLEKGGISIINMNGIYFSHFMQIFADITLNGNKSIPIRCAGITDNDPPVDSKPLRSKPIEGLNPALKLMDKVNKSEWARLYSNLKTFEYDLAIELDNLKTIIPIAKSLVDTDGSIKKQYEEYERVNWTGASEELKANAALFLLKHIEKEKGEFSQAIASKMSSSSCILAIPEYIGNAVMWACGV